MLLSSACDMPGHQAPRHSPTHAVPIASPRVTATWASFSTGANKPHQTLGDGLQITDVVTGSGAVAAQGDSVTVEYIGWLDDGRQIASSDADGQAFRFTLGTGSVIAGWEEGVPGLAAGGLRRLVIPPSLAYGSQGVLARSGEYAIPPNSTLVFVVRLVALTPPG